MEANRSTSSNIFSLQQIIETDFPRPSALTDGLFDCGEIVLFIARQKEGKSTLALQLAIDVSRGDAFLGQYNTTATTVLYVDYENRFYRLKERSIDLANDRRIDNLHVKAFEYLRQRDIGLFGPQYECLRRIVRALQPGLLIIDPLRYALNQDERKGTADETVALKAIDQVSELQRLKPKLTTILVHHLKKRQDHSKNAPGTRLRSDPRAWIEQVYGSQALLAHVDNIWGLEEDRDGYTFATVPRSQEPLILTLEKQPESQRFLLSPHDPCVFQEAEQTVWSKLPHEFTWREAENLCCPGSSTRTLNNTIKAALKHGLLVKDTITKRYRKKLRI